MSQHQDSHLASHLAGLRQRAGWSLDQAAQHSGVSRATLARIEKAQVSPTTETLGRLCAAYQISMSRLLAQVEDQAPACISPTARSSWQDPATGFRRTILSPATRQFAGEVLQCHLPAGQVLSYSAPPRPGLEHHLLLQTGALEVTVDGHHHPLCPGDCLRYQLHGASRFVTGSAAADYLLFLL